MIIQAGAYRYEVAKRHGLTHETFTRRYALARLNETLIRARRDLEQLPAGRQRRRQREKIWRLEQQIDRLSLELETHG